MDASELQFARGTLMAAIKEITLSAKGQIVIPAERREDVLTRLEGKCHAGTLAA